MPHEFADLISGPAIHHDPELCRLLEEADNNAHAVLFAMDFSRNQTLYVNKKIENLFGYPVTEIIQGGIQFIVAIAHASDFPKLVASHTTYAFQVRAHDFDPRSFLFHRYEWTAVKKSNQHIGVACLTVPLTFTERREIEFAVGFIIADGEQSESVEHDIIAILKKIKQRHNELAIAVKDQTSLPGIRPNHPVISSRELQVLQLLAKGLSTKEIASKLGISSHTAESHRKHLLGKFGAKNSAELMIKANRLYGLDK